MTAPPPGMLSQQTIDVPIAVNVVAYHCVEGAPELRAVRLTIPPGGVAYCQQWPDGSRTIDLLDCLYPVDGGGRAAPGQQAAASEIGKHLQEADELFMDNVDDQSGPGDRR